MNERKLGYNFWYIGDILAGISQSYSSVQETGAIIVVNMHWECEYQSPNECTVDWYIFRADSNSVQSENYLWLSNYQSPQSIQLKGFKLKILESRFLRKVYGIKILFNITGEMKRFSWIALAVNVGSMAGILSIVPVLMDFILRRKYERYKC